MFGTRLGRREFVLSSLIFLLVAAMLARLSILSTVNVGFILQVNPLFQFVPLYLLSLRYRDCGVSGWLALVGLIPEAFILLWLIMAFFPGEKGTNQYGVRKGLKPVIARAVIIFISGAILVKLAVLTLI
uniref:DUF805 domain-containing protein n=1 Tax=Thaumasiovibrio occultus TaxID=1891184 RepID=UPI00131D671D|nr:DUF805 domain-containing protein [Thaumasiovibrio occultus]